VDRTWVSNRLSFPSLTGRELGSGAVAALPQARHFRHSRLLLSSDDGGSLAKYKLDRHPLRHSATFLLAYYQYGETKTKELITD